MSAATEPPAPAGAPGRRRSVIVGAAVLVLAAFALVGGVYVGHRAQAPVAVSDAAALVYGVTLPGLDGQPVALAQFKGKPMVVNFWATWCGPCREEMPGFVKFQETNGNAVQFVGIGVDDAAKLQQFARSINLNYPSLVGGYGALELSRTLGNTAMALPFTLVLDRHGQVAHTQLGPLPPERLKAILAQMS